MSIVMCVKEKKKYSGKINFFVDLGIAFVYLAF